MMPVVSNTSIDQWIHNLTASGNVSPDRVERVRELACEANTQWKRKLLVQRIVESVQRDRRRAVPFQDIYEVHGVHFTTETMRILEDGIQQSLRNFCRMLMDIISTWDSDFFSRHDKAVVSKRAALVVSHAPSCLWGSLDTMELSQLTVHSRLMRAVDGLWNTHAKPAIESERNHMAEGIQRLRTMHYVCEEYLKAHTGAKTVPTRFSSLFSRMQQRAIAALAWLLANSYLLDQSTDTSRTVSSTLKAYKSGETEARHAMDQHAERLKTMLQTTIRLVENVYSHEPEWEGWHCVLVWGQNLSPPDEATSSLIVQPPSYSSSFWTTSRVHCSVASSPKNMPHPVRSQPTVRFCALLRKLVHMKFLRLDLIGVDYLRLLAHADYARYHRNVNKIVEDELIPVGHLAGHSFDTAWFLETRAPVVYDNNMSPMSSMPRMSDISLVQTDEDQTKNTDVPAVTENTITTTGNTEKSIHVVTKHTPITTVVPEGVLVDHCLMTTIALISRSNATTSDHIGPYFNTFHIGTTDVSHLVRNALGVDTTFMTEMCLNQRITSVMKMFCVALSTSGMQASFGKHKSHLRTKKLKISWTTEEEHHRAKNMAKVAQLADDIASHLHHGSPLPLGVEWNIPERSRRRRRVRDAKCVSNAFTTPRNVHFVCN